MPKKDKITDILDKKILYQLDIDSRQTYSQIGKKLNKSPQFVKYRVEQLINKGIINYFYPLVEFKALGYMCVSYYIKLQNIGLEKEKELIEYLYKKKNIQTLALGEGHFDIMITLFVKNITELEKTLSDINTKFGEYFILFDNVFEMYNHKLNRSYLIDKKELIETKPMGILDKEVKLDDIDRKIISLLDINARVSVLEIAKKMKSTSDIVIHRIKKLRKEEIIKQYSISINNNKLGFPLYKLLLKMKNFAQEEQNKFLMYCVMHPNISFYRKCFGSWDIVLDIEIESRDRFRWLQKELKYKFNHIIHKTESTYVYQKIKERSLPIEYVFE
jgi:DNA-binding Lrp family transcriptional regulator